MSSSASCAEENKTPVSKKWDPERIWRVARNIKESPKINLLSLLSTFLARMLVEENNEATEVLHPETVEKSKDIIDMMHRDAVRFCRGRGNKKATDLKKYLRKYRGEKKEELRRSALCSAFNSTLSAFREKQYSGLPNKNNDQGELIFIPNDGMKLESEHIQQHMPKSKRAPDILATSTTTLHKHCGHHNEADYEDWIRLVDRNALRDAPGSSKKLEWAEVHQAWELAVIPAVDTDLADKDEKESRKILHTYNLRSRSSSQQQQQQNSRKRRSEEQQLGKSKKARIDSTQEPRPFRLQVADEQSNLLPELRCAYYALERLSSTWTVNHSTSVLLEDTKLSLRWYDAQGCFESEVIDIWENMPIFVVFLVVLQRFDGKMWGLSSENVDCAETDEEVFKLEQGRCRFELVGRRTFGCTAARFSRTSDGEDEVPMFFKSSWVKCKDPKEPDIIKTVHERANKLLPEKYQKMVTDHIPTVTASRILNKGSTSVIRRLIQEVDGSVQFPGEARVRVWMVTHKLEQSEGLDPPVFWRIFWESLRCHYLLWKLGIAHRDISISNLMCGKRNGDMVGVLNDYDMAIVMEPGSRNPESDGYERGGTTPFMAVDLLTCRNAKLTRWYRHDLESFAWCLLWNMLSSPSRSWSEGSLDDIVTKRRSFLFCVSEHLLKAKEEWMPYYLFVMAWFNNMRNTLQSFEVSTGKLYMSTKKPLTDAEKIALRDTGDVKKEDMDYVQFIVDAAREHNGDECECFMQDTSWISVELLQS